MPPSTGNLFGNLASGNQLIGLGPDLGLGHNPAPGAGFPGAPHEPSLKFEELITAGANDVLTTDWLRVAAVHRKRHNNLLPKIRTRIEEAGSWGLLNSKQSSYLNEQGKEQPMFVMT